VGRATVATRPPPTSKRAAADPVRMIEAQVQAAFVKYLIEGGWQVTTGNDDHTDVIARRDEYVGCRGQGSDFRAGSRRRHGVWATASKDARSARDTSIRLSRAGTRPEGLPFVSSEVRRRIGIDVWTVDEAGNVQLVE
jgi:hypothetical protein